MAPSFEVGNGYCLAASPVFKAHPFRTVAALEAATRTETTTAAAAASTTSATADVSSFPQSPAADLFLLAVSVFKLLALIGAPDAVDASNLLQPLPYAFSAVISGLKCCRHLCNTSVMYQEGFHWQTLAALGSAPAQSCRIASTWCDLVQSSASSSSDSSSSNSSKNSSSMIPWMIATCRLLIAVGEQMKELPAQSARYTPQDRQQKFVIIGRMQDMLESVGGAVAWLQEHVSVCSIQGCMHREGDIACTSQLKQQARDLCRLLESVAMEWQQQTLAYLFKKGIGPADPRHLELVRQGRIHDLQHAITAVELPEKDLRLMFVKVFSEELPRQLIDLGTAACAVYPTPFCCNNPLCGNVAKLSELELVGGKGCVCSGCQVARYCGRGCQTAHWKQHKPACKKL